jgi:hypothetical protein
MNIGIKKAKLVLKSIAFLMLLFCLKANIYADLQYSLKAGVEQTNFLTESINETRYDQYTDFNGAIKLIDRRTESVFKLDGHLHQNLNGSGDNLVAVPEFFYSWLLSESQALTAGRKTHGWNRGDELWGLGYFQPATRIDSINPQMMGLTGFWWEASGKQVRFTALVSPFFLPDQGPNIREEDGQLVSSNPWFDSPVSQLRLASLESDIKYKIKWPQPDDIFQHNSVAVQMRWGLLKDYEDGAYLNISLADKPINQLTLGLVGVQKIGVGPVSKFTEAEIIPMVTRHQVGGAEVGLQYGRLNLFLAGIVDEPYDIQSGMLVNKPARSQSAFLGGEYLSDVVGIKSKHLFSAIRIWETPVELASAEEMDLGSNMEEFERFQFTDAVMWASSINLGSRQDQVGFRYIYSIPEDGGLLSIFADLTLDKNLKASFNLDLLGSTKEVDLGFVSRHRENDRAQVSMSYVF